MDVENCEETNQEENEEGEDQSKKNKKTKNEQQKKTWEDWWRGVIKLEPTSTTAKTKAPEKKKNRKDQMKKIEKNGTSVEKKKLRNKNLEVKKSLDGLRQVSVKEMIQKCEKEGHNPELENSKGTCLRKKKLETEEGSWTSRK